ncbi:inner centromere protein-like [Cheilinus undulatus]|uniref:inner centromere protein-like n=1 Tax=Cheilinus undulatus TaxID=241271 RepID=UPI001BD561F5|nr:inner centromere protein-like [Cheilinus undulatus]
MESSIEASSTAAISKPKPGLAPKPRLAPKPFSLQKNSSIRSINAPKTVSTTSKPATQKTTPAKQPPSSESKPSSVSALNTKNKPNTTTDHEATPYKDTIDSGVGKSEPASKATPPKEAPKSEPSQKDDVIETNHKTPADIVPESEQKEGKKKEDESQASVIKKLDKSDGDISSAIDQKYRFGSTRKRLPAELTSMFESGGPCLPPQPTVTVSTAKNDANRPESAPARATSPAQTTSEPSNNEGGLSEDYSGGGSIKRRISQLFDSSSRPEVTTKREEPEIVNSTGGVKQRIKNWVTETNSEADKKPQVLHRGRSKSFEPPIASTAVETPEKPSVEPSTSKTSDEVDRPSKVSPAERPTDSPKETLKDAPSENKALESPAETSEENTDKTNMDGVQLRNRGRSLSQSAADEIDSAAGNRPLKRDKVKRRSVHFGVVERDDGGPPVPLGSDPDSSEEEGEEEEAPKEEIPESIPVYRRVGSFEKKDNDAQTEEEERLKHLEFERRRRAEEHEQARLQIEEELKQKEVEEERERQMARQREEEEKERARLREEELERQRKEEWERERLKEEQMERERQREEERERERQREMMLQRQREEERERARQEEEKLKREQEEREKERLKEEREKQRLREEEIERLRERERQRQKEEEERLIHAHRSEGILREEEINLEKQREDEWEKEWVKKTESLGRGEGEREKERLRQEERERERLKEEAEEKERERLRMLKEAEMERLREIEIEKQREEERKEEEQRRQLERERVEELERKMKEELERKQARELEEKFKLEERRKEETRLFSDAPHKSESSLLPSESQIEVVYDDFSIKQSLIDVDFDDFSVKPKKWGSQTKKEEARQRWEEDPVKEQEVEALVPVEVSRRENKMPEQVWKPDSPLSTLTQDSPEEEEPGSEGVQLISIKFVEDKMMEKEETVEEETKEDDENNQKAQVNSYVTTDQDKDTDALIDNEPDQQHEACEEEPSQIDSPQTGPEEAPEVSPEGIDTTDSHTVEEPAPFPESSTPLLDTSLQRSKADLSKRRIRSRPSRVFRTNLSTKESPDWRTRDSTDDKEAKQRDSDSEEEQPKIKRVSSTPQKVPVFPGLSPSALLAQLKRRTGGGGTGGGGEETEEEKESQKEEEVAPSPSQLSRSPRSASLLAGAARVLPPIGSGDKGSGASPAWLKELKSKKRMSQHDGEA